MSGSTIKSMLGLLGVLVVLVGLSGVGQAADIKIDDVDATVKSESAIIQGAVQDETTAIQGTVQTESTAVQNAVGAVQTELTTQHGIITEDIAEVKDLVEALDGAAGGGLSAFPPWSQIIPAAERFVLVLDRGEAVLDKETGLVWEQSPDTTLRNWIGAISHCANREVGGRKGWQLPMREQLASLVDTSNAAPALPTGHPFLNVQSAFYWSATTLANAPTSAWFVLFDDGVVGAINKGTSIPRTWCVRGGQSFDGNTHDTLH
jgi:hypothetical protein